LPVGTYNKTMNILPEITEDQYMVLEFIPDSIEKRRINSLYEPRIQYSFKSPHKNESRAFKAAYIGSKKRIVMTVGEIQDRGNPQEILASDAEQLLGVVAGGRSLFRVLVVDNPVEEKVVEEVVKEPVVDEIMEEASEETLFDVNVSISEMKKVIVSNELDEGTITMLIDAEKSNKNRNGMIKLLEAQL